MKELLIGRDVRERDGFELKLGKLSQAEMR